MSALLRLYPRGWRKRYGDEMEALLEARPVGRRAQFDLARGALDAWLHPPAPSRVPAVAALVGGGLWTVVAAAVVFQPAPPQWPGYIMEIVGLALVAAAFLFVATLGCSLRAGDRGGGARWLAVALTGGGYLAWIGALAATAAAMTDGPALAAAQSVAMVGTALVGVVLVRRGDEAVGLLLMVGPIAMLVPWTFSWLVLGAAWNAVGWVLILNRSPRPGTGWHAA